MGAADEIELFAQPIFEKTLVAEMQPLGLIGEQNETWAAKWTPA